MMKRPEEYLKEKDITVNSDDHHYQYLYDSMVKIIEQVYNDAVEETIQTSQFFKEELKEDSDE